MCWCAMKNASWKIWALQIGCHDPLIFFPEIFDMYILPCTHPPFQRHFLLVVRAKTGEIPNKHTESGYIFQPILSDHGPLAFESWNSFTLSCAKNGPLGFLEVHRFVADARRTFQAQSLLAAWGIGGIGFFGKPRLSTFTIATEAMRQLLTRSMIWVHHLPPEEGLARQACAVWQILFIWHSLSTVFLAAPRTHWEDSCAVRYKLRL